MHSAQAPLTWGATLTGQSDQPRSFG